MTNGINSAKTIRKAVRDSIKSLRNKHKNPRYRQAIILQISAQDRTSRRGYTIDIVFQVLLLDTQAPTDQQVTQFWVINVTQGPLSLFPPSPSKITPSWFVSP